MRFIEGSGSWGRLDQADMTAVGRVWGILAMTDRELAESGSIQGKRVQGALGLMNDSQSPLK